MTAHCADECGPASRNVPVLEVSGVMEDPECEMSGALLERDRAVVGFLALHLDLNVTMRGGKEGLRDTILVRWY